MRRSFTRAIGAGQRVGDGQWRIDSGRLSAELAARYPDNRILR
jgi:hypothetical protein